MKGKIKRLICILIGVFMLGAVSVGCGGKSSENVQFWVKGSMIEIDQYTRLVEKFNNGYGKENGIKVDLRTMDSGGYMSTITTTANSETAGPDVFLMGDNDWKQTLYGHYFTNIQPYVDQITDIDIGIASGDMRKTTYSRLRLNTETNTSNDDDPLYALPLDSQPTALYYNKTMLENAGIIVISVDEKDMDAWNRGEIADRTGKKKADFAKLNGITVPKKGYYRSANPYHFDGIRTKNWKKPIGEVLVFNNRIAMNWDEVEDLAMLFSASTNPQTGNPKVSEYNSQYGYFTEWWFNYGWAVGGDCLQDLTGNGDWNFSLLDPNSNYIVKEGTYTGLYTGRVYKEGETLDFKDKMDIADGELVVADDFGDYHHESKTGAKVNIRQDVLDKKASGVLAELPSTLEAFCRYLKLGAEKNATIGKPGELSTSAGIKVSPNPNTFTGTTSSMSYFWSGNIALLANSSVYMPTLAEQAEQFGFEWDVAPLVVYKEYENPSDPSNDTVVARGKQAGHSNTISMVLRTKSPKKLNATKFMMWAASAEAQELRASLGFFPNQESLMSKIEFQRGKSATNMAAFSEALEYQRQGDWMYMPDHAWVEEWCVDLNSNVRNGTKTYDDWYSPAIIRTNTALVGYKQWSWK